jgi:hypothetical protein
MNGAFFKFGLILKVYAEALYNSVNEHFYLSAKQEKINKILKSVQEALHKNMKELRLSTSAFRLCVIASRLTAAKESVGLVEQRLDYEKDGDEDRSFQLLRLNRKKARMVYLKDEYSSHDTIEVMSQLDVEDLIRTVAQGVKISKCDAPHCGKWPEERLNAKLPEDTSCVICQQPATEDPDEVAEYRCCHRAVLV